MASTTEPASPPPSSRPQDPARGGGALDRYFGIRAAGSSIPTELRAGLTTFLTMSYIIFVNPSVLSAAIDVPNGFVQLIMVTCLAAMFGSLRPDVLAPFTQFTEPSQISDPSPGQVPGAIPEDQPHHSSIVVLVDKGVRRRICHEV